MPDDIPADDIVYPVCVKCKQGCCGDCLDIVPTPQGGAIACGCESDTCAPEDDAPTYGMCTACGAVEVALANVTGTRDLSGIGESAKYPIGFGCELCA